MVQILLWLLSASLLMATCVLADLFRLAPFRREFHFAWPVGEWISGFFIREFHLEIGPVLYRRMASDIGANHAVSRTFRIDPILEERRRGWPDGSRRHYAKTDKKRADAPVAQGSA